MTYVPLPQKDKGGQDEIWTADAGVEELMRQILAELRIMNMHLKSMTDEEITEGDIQC